MEDTPKIRVGVVGFGLLGKNVAKAVSRTRDLELVAIFSKRDPATLQNSLAKVYPTASAAEFRDRIDVMIVCDAFGTGLQTETPYLAQFFHTVDAHPLRGNPPTAEEIEAQKKLRLEELQTLAQDFAKRQAAHAAAHAGENGSAQASEATASTAESTNGLAEEETTEIMGMTLPAFVKEPVFQPVYLPFKEYFEKVDAAARTSHHVSLCAVGWEPGFMSFMRTFMGALFPKSQTWTFWGRGVSLQWSNAVRSFEGVVDAVVYQCPKEEPLMAVLENRPIYDDSRKALHYLEVYAVVDDRFDKEQLREQIIHMPGWFADYDTQVTFLTKDEMREFHARMTHAGLVLSRASTSQGINEQIKLEVDMDSNPEFTAYVLTAGARAVVRAGREKFEGARTMVEIPLAWFSPDSLEQVRHQISVS